MSHRNRSAATKFFLDILEEMQSGNKNVTMYKKHFNNLSDEEFEDLMLKMSTGEIVLPYYCANLVDKDVDIANSLKVGKILGNEFFQRVWLIDPITNVEYLTPEKYFIVHLPIRRQAQHVTKGKSVVESNDFIDSLTGQPTSNSKTSRMSLPEINNLASLGLHKGIEELISVRGGNEKGFIDAKRQMLEKGEYTLKSISDLGYEVTATTTLRAFLYGMHFDTTL